MLNSCAPRKFICESEVLCCGSPGVSDEINRSVTVTWEALAQS